MWKQTLSGILVALWLLSPASECLAKEILFQAEPTNFDYARGLGRRLGEAYRIEFDPRMFVHRAWIQRLSYFSSEPDLDETLEIYSKPDGSRWLTHRRAVPSLSSILQRRIVDGVKFDLKKELDAVRITSHDVALPPGVAKEIELLWQTMLPGVTNPPRLQTLYTHVPIFDAFVRQNHSVETGRVCLQAYNTPVYRAFVDVITDLRAVCDRGSNSADPVFRRLPAKIRNLRARL
jgi:hypothetical protein